MSNAASGSAGDRNLLFGILAVHMGFVSRDGLIAAMHDWLADRSKSIGELLTARGELSAAHCSLLEPLVDAHVAQHGGDVQQSLAALSSDGGVGPALRSLAEADAGLQASLSLLPQPEPVDPVPPASLREAGWASSAGPYDGKDPPAQGDVPVRADGRIEPQPVGSPGGPASDDPFGKTLVQHTLDEPDRPKLRFRILRPHDEGGLGRVFVALDSELNREVAFKEIKPEHARKKDAQPRFVVEAEVTGGLEHPGIVPVYGLGHFDDGRPFYAMRFIRGQSLHDAVKAFHKPPQSDEGGRGSRRAAPHDPAPANEEPTDSSNEVRPRKVVRQEPHPPTDTRADFHGRDFRDLINRLIDVCNAMQDAHDRKVLHRDLKPGNIMLGRYGETLVVDWGLAKAVGKDNPLVRSADGELPIVPASGSQSAPTLPQV